MVCFALLKRARYEEWWIKDQIETENSFGIGLVVKEKRTNNFIPLNASFIEILT